MDEIIEKIQKSRNVKPLTLKSYMTLLIKLMNLIQVKEDVKKMPNTLINYIQVINTLNTSELTDSYKKNLYSFILVLLDLFKGNAKLYNKLYEKYRLEFDKLKDEIDDQQMEQEKSPVQEKNWVSWNKLKKLPTSWRRKLRNDKSNHI